jgi:hypothetical protein
MKQRKLLQSFTKVYTQHFSMRKDRDQGRLQSSHARIIAASLAVDTSK